MSYKTSKLRWNSMQTAKRLPEVELEKKMVDIRRAHAHFKRDNRLDESRMWQQLFENDKTLKSSLVRQYSVDDVLQKKVSLQKQAVKDDDEFLPPSEAYRQFIIFKAATSSKIFKGRTPMTVRPRYDEIHSNRDPKELNRLSYNQLLKNYNEMRKADDCSKQYGILIAKDTPADTNNRVATEKNMHQDRAVPRKIDFKTETSERSVIN